MKNEFNISNELANQFLEVFHKWENSIDGSHSWYETSASGHLEYWECEGNIVTLWKENVGYKTILDILMVSNVVQSWRIRNKALI